MTGLTSLVPARFLTLTAHLVMVISIFWSRENNVQSCLPLEFTEEQFRAEDTRLVVALSVSLGLFVVEFAGFFSGVSMFSSNQAVLSLVAHSSACVSLSFFVFQQWPCWTYWIVFILCSCFGIHSAHFTEVNMMDTSALNCNEKKGPGSAAFKK